MTDRQFLWWRIKTWFFHLYGAHTWVPTEDWKVTEGYVEIEIVGYSCWVCPARKGPTGV